ncbi:MAG: transporter [Xanthomonadaceae bacterium]|nr:transporter [Xanthomonadaceae bacterium]
MASPAMPPSPPPRQSPDDAWWTGPMLANSAATLPRGHFLIEPYIYDVSSPHADGFGSQAYMLYGLTDRLTAGLIPVLGYNRVQGAGDSAGIGLGDVSVQAQYRLTRFHESGSLPTISLQLQETLPTGAYERLGKRPGNGLGSGAATTTLQLNTQTYFWLANGRILRMRFNMGQSWYRRAHLADISVYGTTAGFRGNARPGNAFFVDAAWEYSLSRRWVLALDVTYRRSHATRVNGYVPADSEGAPAISVHRSFGAGEAFGFAPAIEYSWNANLGMLFGTRLITGPHTTTTITPAVAINYVH